MLLNLRQKLNEGLVDLSLQFLQSLNFSSGVGLQPIASTFSVLRMERRISDN